MTISYSKQTQLYLFSPTDTPADSIIQAAFNDLICFSHLRWNFVYQRPQHLMSRWAGTPDSGRCRVWYIEEPVWGDMPGLSIRSEGQYLSVVVPHLRYGTSAGEAVELQRIMIDQLLAEQRIENYALWYYTPMALLFSDQLKPRLTVFDCMDELSAFLGAPPLLLAQEQQLLDRADIVFTGGYSLYEAKQKRHSKVYAFPSSIDYDHFAKARPGLARPGLARPGLVRSRRGTRTGGPAGLARRSTTASADRRPGLPDPADQQAIGQPRIGYSGVIDERMDLSLIDQLACYRPDWQFVFLGPVVKISPDDLPSRPNLYYLGMKAYDELPAYFSHWRAAIMPFAINEATRFISPTKTPEYLAAGLPVVSTPIRDVLRTYGGWEQVVIADSVSAFETGLSLVLGKPMGNVQPELDRFLREQSWDNTWEQMQRIITGYLHLGKT